MSTETKENEKMIEYRLFFQEQYEVLIDEQKRPKDIKPYREEIIKKILPDDILKKNLQIKKYFYNCAINDRLLSPTDVVKRYKERSDGFVTQMKELFLESRFSKILGLKSQTNKILLEMVNNPKVCMALAKSEMLEKFQDFLGGEEEAAGTRSLLFKAYKSLKKEYVFDPEPYEQQCFLKHLFGKNFQIDGVSEEKDELYNECSDIFFSGYAIFNYKKELKKEKKQKEERNIKNNKNISSSIDMYEESVRISEYLSGFCYYMVKIKDTNPIIHTKQLTKKGYINRAEERKEIWGSVEESEKQLLEETCRIIDYLRRNRKVDKGGRYYNFVINYLRKNKDIKETGQKKSIGLYLFEQVFGFEYINFVIEKIEEKFNYFEIPIDNRFGEKMEKLFKLLAIVMRDFEPILRNSIAEKIIDLYCGVLFLNSECYKTQNECGEWKDKDEVGDEYRYETLSRFLEDVDRTVQSFLEDCRTYIENREIELKDNCQKEITWDESNMDFKHYQQLLDFKDNKKDELRDINSITGAEYLKSYDLVIREEYLPWILAYVQYECWDYNIYGF